LTHWICVGRAEEPDRELHEGRRAGAAVDHGGDSAAEAVGEARGDGRRADGGVPRATPG